MAEDNEILKYTGLKLSIEELEKKYNKLEVRYQESGGLKCTRDRGEIKERIEKLEVIYEQNVDRILAYSNMEKEFEELKELKASSASHTDRLDAKILLIYQGNSPTEADILLGGEKSVAVSEGRDSESERNRDVTSFPTVSKPPEQAGSARQTERLCIGCSERFEGGVYGHLCGTCANRLLNEGGIIVEKADLEFYMNAFEQLTYGQLDEHHISLDRHIKLRKKYLGEDKE